MDGNEAHNAISNALIVGGGFERLLMLYDIIIDTDTPGSMLDKDSIRVSVLCDYYGIELSPAESKLLVDYLSTIRRERRRMILSSGEGSVEAKKAFIEKLESYYGEHNQ